MPMYKIMHVCMYYILCIYIMIRHGAKSVCKDLSKVHVLHILLNTSISAAQ